MSDEDLIREARDFERAERIQGHEEAADRYARFADALESRPSLSVQSEEALATANCLYQQEIYPAGVDPKTPCEECTDRARALIESGVVSLDGDYYEGLEEGIKIGRAEVAPSLVAESREAVIETIRTTDLADVQGTFRLDSHEAAIVADALLAPGGPVRVAEVTAEQAWDECIEAAKRVKPWSHVPANPYVGNSRKEQTDG